MNPKKTPLTLIVIITIIILATVKIVLYDGGFFRRETPQALLTYVPNFDSLTLLDLPGINDSRGKYDYNGHLLLTGLGQLIEYDQNLQQYIRVSDPNVIGWRGCRLMNSEKIGDYLFISCSKFANETFSPFFLYKIDLNSGKVVKTYFNYPPKNGESTGVGIRTDLMLATNGNLLWMSSWDGVETLNIDTEELTTYNNQVIFGNSCKPAGIFNNKGEIVVVPVDNEICRGANIVSVFDPEINSWMQIFTDSRQYLTDHNLEWPHSQQDSTYILPLYVAMSKLYNQRYYLLANDGVYYLELGKFPEKIINSSLVANFSPDFNLRNYLAGTSAFSADNRFLVFINTIYLGETPERLLDILLADLENKKLFRLNGVTKLNQEIIKALRDETLSFKSGNTTIDIVSNNEPIGRIDLLKRFIEEVKNNG